MALSLVDERTLDRMLGEVALAATDLDVARRASGGHA
jgi:hypothetical protein